MSKEAVQVIKDASEARQNCANAKICSYEVIGQCV